MERRKSELKSKSCPVLSRQSLAGGGHRGPSVLRGTAGTWVPSKGHKGGSSIFFLQKEQITLPAQLLKKIASVSIYDWCWQLYCYRPFLTYSRANVPAPRTLP